MNLPDFYVDDIIKTALAEDINYIDVSSIYIFSEDDETRAYFVAKASGVLCGIDVALRVFKLLDSSFEYTVYKKDGDRIDKGDRIADFRGKTVKLLAGERTALNLLQHMSGIATATRRAADLCEGTGASVAETRKTLPGMRALQKYAVTVGGGRNHRFNLSDAAMLKDNHIDACGGITEAVAKFRSKAGHMIKVEVETRNIDEVMEALAAGADVIMLDNMSIPDMAEAVKAVDGRAVLEASGNITLDNIAEVAKTGVDVISMGALTHSVQAFDISMRVES